MNPQNKGYKKKVVLVGGCFDLLHFGHIEFLKQAKALGNYLIVALESDENVTRRKGARRPIHPQDQRKRMLEALSFVDEVISLPTLTTDSEYAQQTEKINPDVIAITQGDAYLPQKKRQAQKIGAQIVEIPQLETPSTSQLLKLLGVE